VSDLCAVDPAISLLAWTLHRERIHVFHLGNRDHSVRVRMLRISRCRKEKINKFLGVLENFPNTRISCTENPEVVF